MNIFHPLGKGVLEPFGNKVYPVVRLLVLECHFSQWLHLNKPLGRQARFDLDPGPFGVTN